ncbi:neuropeptides B/W receptor type 2-like [Diadema antillarum]|uniref:neuropeptides B/W receptor type 2-like n=1 Tax=Diadema antillarum TaxID=105358 RepID=UPI003A83CA50
MEPTEWSNISHVCYQSSSVIDLTSHLRLAESFAYSKSDLFYIAVLLPFLCSAGVILNCSFLFVVHRVPTMKTITNVYLVNVAIADVLFLLAVLVFKLSKLRASPVVRDVSGLGPAACIILYTVANIARFASLGFISAVTWERFCAVCRPYSRRSTSSYAITVSITIWLLATALSATIIPAYGKYFEACVLWPDSPDFDSWPSRVLLIGQFAQWHSSYSNIAQTIPFFITFIVNTYFFFRIIRGLDAAMMHRTWGGRRSETDSALRSQTIRMLVVNGVAYFLCLALFQFLSLSKTIVVLTKSKMLLSVKQRKILLDAGRTLEYLNSVINPVIYTVMSRRYRDAFKAAFKCGRYLQLKRVRAATMSNSFPLGTTITNTPSRTRNTSL